MNDIKEFAIITILVVAVFAVIVGSQALWNWTPAQNAVAGLGNIIGGATNAVATWLGI